MWLDFASAFLQKFLEVVLPVLATALAGLAIAWITKLINDVKARLTEDQEWIINQAIDAAVLAAEQIDLKGVVIDKKDYALQVAMQWLSLKGIKLNLNILDARIEAAVFDQFNRNKADLSKTANAGTD
jgi:type II secretory pathway pseudopilin PulG